MLWLWKGGKLGDRRAWLSDAFDLLGSTSRRRTAEEVEIVCGRSIVDEFLEGGKWGRYGYVEGRYRFASLAFGCATAHRGYYEMQEDGAWVTTVNSVKHCFLDALGCLPLGLAAMTSHG